MSSADSQSPPAAAGPASADPASYRVLARKYRPATFDDLIGQEAMVRTISNAFDTGRIPQAWILTGVRGVGKTTTARILARALNYELPDGSVAGPTIHMPKLGVHCQAIMESRHLDVLEMDAASHRGIDDVRQLTDSSRYAPLEARYKVYILDEVHMFTDPAWNALLKTLEEPPPHVKFIFATTEIGEVPITVKSRCQRFDLRRIDAALLVDHLGGIAQKESVQAEPEALALIARAAEGSVRDSLSLLDQAIAHAGAGAGQNNAAGPVRAEDVRQMLGLADRVRIVDLFEALLRGDIATALKELRDQYDSGADPLTVLTELAEFTHFVTRVKVVPAVAQDVSISEAERTRGHAFATQLSMRVLSRTWQMLLKALEDVKEAPRPLAAAEMALVRIAYAADLPTPDEVMRSLGEEKSSATRPTNGGGSAPAPAAGGGFAPRYDAPRGAPRGSAAPATAPGNEPVARLKEPAQQAEPVVMLARFEDLIALAAEKRDLTIKTALERDVRLVRFEDGQLEISVLPSAPKTLVGDLSRKLAAWTGRRWMVAVSSEEGAPTLRQQMENEKAELMRGVRGDPLVQSVLQRFPGAEIVDVRRTETAPEVAPEDVLPDPERED
jgi:DNA polymerase-3 subunit gamma/tau